jgi:hypothetical protein
MTTVSSYALQQERSSTPFLHCAQRLNLCPAVSDDARFRKKPKLMPVLAEINSIFPEHPGLFTAELDDPGWGIARAFASSA